MNCEQEIFRVIKNVLSQSLVLKESQCLMTETYDIKYNQWVMLDLPKVDLVLNNLLMNAFQHSKARNVSIHSWIEGNYLICSIADDGCGIPSKYITDPDEFRFEEKFSCTLGLGISVCLCLTKIMNGKIDFKITTSGTTVTVKFPVKMIETPELKEVIEPNLKILVVDDSKNSPSLF
jgi:K+-sensing histidine kinase KdpD